MMADLDGLFQHADKLFNRAWLQHLSHIYWEPTVNVYECSEALVFLIDLPGIAREDVSIHLVKDTLILTGIRPDPRPSDAVRCLHMEMPQGRFRKQVRIAIPIDRRRISAELKGGILRIVIPKEVTW